MTEEERYQRFLAAMKLLGIELPNQRFKGLNLSIQLDREYRVSWHDPYNKRLVRGEFREPFEALPVDQTEPEAPKPSEFRSLDLQHQLEHLLSLIDLTDIHADQVSDFSVMFILKHNGGLSIRARYCLKESDPDVRESHVLVEIQK